MLQYWITQETYYIRPNHEDLESQQISNTYKQIQRDSQNEKKQTPNETNSPEEELDEMEASNLPDR